jgi:protein-S-isoprenylcysteine O-methyltransferase Ste14
VSRWRVRLGQLLGVASLALAQPTPRSLLTGFVLGLIGEALRLWASGHIEKTETLATGGPYAHTRNPLYLGSLLMASGFCVAAASAWVVTAVALYLLVFYPAVIREESRFLRAKFPDAYGAWERVVPVLLPRLTPAGPRSSRFEWRRIKRNREWRAVLALPLVFAALSLVGALRGWMAR